jgi:uncharacterized protein with HEPN domain
MHRQPVEYLHHILDECFFIINTISNITKDQLLNDEIMKRAIVRSLEIIGEACKKVPVDIKLDLHTVNWKNIAGMRDRLIYEINNILLNKIQVKHYWRQYELLEVS